MRIESVVMDTCTGVVDPTVNSVGQLLSVELYEPPFTPSAIQETEKGAPKGMLLSATVSVTVCVCIAAENTSCAGWNDRRTPLVAVVNGVRVRETPGARGWSTKTVKGSDGTPNTSSGVFSYWCCT